jgi:preprotein translocase subunit SecA
MIDALGIDEDDAIEHRMLSKAIENAQKKVEGNNFSIRKHLLDYDHVMNEQREIIYGERRRVLMGENLKDSILNMVRDVIERYVGIYAPETAESPDEWNLIGLYETLAPVIHCRLINLQDLAGAEEPRNELTNTLYNAAVKLYDRREFEFEPERMREIERIIMLRVIDQRWMDHIDDMDQMRQGISLRAYAQRDPLVEYKFVSYDMFEELSNNIKLEVGRGMFNVRLATPPEKREQVAKPVNVSNEQGSVKGPTRRKGEKIGRNDPCPCGSGKKYKNCCGRE